MKRSVLASILAAAFTFALGSTALAQDKGKTKAAPAASGKGVKSYDFTGDTIDGDLVKPDGEFVDPRKFATHTSLIRVRKDFIREIVKSAEDL